MYKYLVVSPYTINKKKANQYFDEFLIRLNAPGIKGKYTFIEELLRLIGQFYSSISRPTFGHQFVVDKRESPSSEKMNETWAVFNKDLHIIFDQQNVIDDCLATNFNYFQTKKENILNKIKTCSEKLNIASAITQSKDSPIFEIKENFDTMSNIDFELIPERDVATYDQSLGGITLRSSLGNRANKRDISKFEVKIYWNGKEITEEELLNSPDINDGKLYGVHADRGENGIRIGLTSLSKAPEYVEPAEELEDEFEEGMECIEDQVKRESDGHGGFIVYQCVNGRWESTAPLTKKTCTEGEYLRVKDPGGSGQTFVYQCQMGYWVRIYARIFEGVIETII